MKLLSWKPIQIIWLLLAAVLLFSCGSSTTLTTRYAPFHPANNTAVNFTFNTSDNDGIARAELFVYEYELYVNPNNNMRSARQRPGGQWGFVRDWNYSSEPTSANETHTFSAGFSAESFVRYLIRITDGKGRNKSEDWYFAAGDWPYGNSPIPIFGKGAPAKTIDVAFIADRTDYSSGRDMLPDLEGLVFDGYHINNAIRNQRQLWSFYYSPQRGFISDFDSGEFTMDIPSSVSSSPIIDHAAIIHTTVKRDWASGGNFGTEPTNIGTAVHESGHSTFDLADEYNTGNCRTSSDPYHNVYSSRSAAETYNTNNGWPASDVEEIFSGCFRVEPSSLNCIMVNDGDATMPDFERSCFLRAIWYYIELTN